MATYRFYWHDEKSARQGDNLLSLEPLKVKKTLVDNDEWAQKTASGEDNHRR